jgi:universal stress protein A
MFKKILVAIDDSQPAMCALSAALELAEQVRAAVILLHVIDSTSAYVPERQEMNSVKLAELRQRGTELMSQTLEKIPRRNHVQRLIVEGDPAECILSAASNWPADLIVIGSDSRGRLAHFLLGSTADSVIRRASCPVMSVRADAEQTVHKTMQSKSTVVA